MASNSLLAIDKLKGSQIIKVAAAHNLREIQAEIGADLRINAEFSFANMVLEGPNTATAVAGLAKALMEQAGAKIKRKDAVRAIEAVISLPVNSCIDRLAFFNDAIAWIKQYYGIPVLSAVVHFDESAHHCHVLLLPLRNGKMDGSKITGGPSHISALHESFFTEVGLRYGLRRPKRRRRLNASIREKCAELVTTAIQSDVTLIDKPEVIAALNQMVANDPFLMMDALGIEVPTPPAKARSFVQIMTKPVKPEPKGIDCSDRMSAQRAVRRANGSNETISCVRFAESKRGPFTLDRASNRTVDGYGLGDVGTSLMSQTEIADCDQNLHPNDDCSSAESPYLAFGRECVVKACDSIDARDYKINPVLERAGLIHRIGGEVCFTAAGMLAMAGMIANDPTFDTDGLAGEAIDRLLHSALQAGLDPEIDVSIRDLLSKRVNPSDEGGKGSLLAAHCREVARTLGSEHVVAHLKVVGFS